MEINGENYENEPLCTFTIPTNVTRVGDNCFANCDSLSKITRIENVKEFGKGCFYRCYKLCKDQYPIVKQIIDKYYDELLSKEHQKQLEEWTGLKCSEIVFDSNKDDWSKDTSVLNERIIGKKQLAFIIENDDEIFGYYFNTQVKREYFVGQHTNNKSFLFNLQSKDNRLEKPMKFEIKHLYYGSIQLSPISSGYESLIYLGDIHLNKENNKNGSCCQQYEDYFNYHGIQKALCGKIGTWISGERFPPKRIFVVQMQ